MIRCSPRLHLTYSGRSTLRPPKPVSPPMHMRSPRLYPLSYWSSHPLSLLVRSYHTLAPTDGHTTRLSLCGRIAD
ncbi:hypothetical protein CTAM01_00020 [Colletotrichum tamarilloi]|uniref:Uncharacterized protein n=1 Tax=Colletotrichum tamarilloi TaxID=1209934 RepID=A0ABQ9RU30_9PEZI|nr:uncharacterized protein CTAM01_00020 [Colletotrichum tamarilloi]KAK1512625.1 hypothetical protein CTAM01_00020 [Colletotrichum tamarilloi]